MTAHRGRAYRRSQRERATQRARRYVLEIKRGWFRDRSAENIEANVRYYATNRQPCSCSMCGNQRRWFATVPMQERRADQATAPEAE